MRIWATSWVTVSCVATASSNSVESSARRFLRANTPVSATTARTALKIRSGSSLLRNRARHNVNTDGSNARSPNARPAAAFHRTSHRSRSIASRSEIDSNACNTITVAITDAGWDGRPRPVNRSANNSSGNTRSRCSARNR